MKSYFHCYARPSVALARWGVTLIPPESLELFCDIVKNDIEARFAAEASAVLAVAEAARRRKNT
jgi:ribonuclease PH